MCGITGILYKNKSRAVDPAMLQQANNTLTHRGPDDSGYYIDGNVGIAMRRLSIIDVAGGHQPIRFILPIMVNCIITNIFVKHFSKKVTGSRLKPTRNPYCVIIKKLSIKNVLKNLRKNGLIKS